MRRCLIGTSLLERQLLYPRTCHASFVLVYGSGGTISDIVSILFVNIAPIPGSAPHCFHSYSVMISFDIGVVSSPLCREDVMQSARDGSALKGLCMGLALG